MTTRKHLSKGDSGSGVYHGKVRVCTFVALPWRCSDRKYSKTAPVSGRHELFSDTGVAAKTKHWCSALEGREEGLFRALIDDIMVHGRKSGTRKERWKCPEGGGNRLCALFLWVWWKSSQRQESRENEERWAGSSVHKSVKHPPFQKCDASQWCPRNQGDLTDAAEYIFTNIKLTSLIWNNFWEFSLNSFFILSLNF